MKPCSFEIRAFNLHSSLYCMLDFFKQSTQFQIFFRLDTRENRIRIVLLLHRQCNNKALLWLWHTWSLPDTMMSIYWGMRRLVECLKRKVFCNQSYSWWRCLQLRLSPKGKVSLLLRTLLWGPGLKTDGGQRSWMTWPTWAAVILATHYWCGSDVMRS